MGRPTLPEIDSMSSTPIASPPYLDHERLRVYQRALALDRLVTATLRRVPRGHADLCDQALRASASTVLNIAGSVGRRGADRARCLRIAYGSALETDAALSVLSHRAPVAEAERRMAREHTLAITALLARFIERSAA